MSGNHVVYPNREVGYLGDSESLVATGRMQSLPGQMRDSNPYSAPVVVPDATKAIRKAPILFRLKTAVILRLGTGPVWPVYLMAYCAYHGIGLGIGGSLSFFSMAYFASAVAIFVARVATGSLLGLDVPSCSERTSRFIASFMAASVLLLGIVLLLGGTSGLASVSSMCSFKRDTRLPGELGS